MNGLKAQIRTAVRMARKERTSPIGSREYAASMLTRAGELRRTAFYVYGNRSS